MDKSRPRIEGMFDAIAPEYDRLNHLISLNMDKKWRRQIVKFIKEHNMASSIILDLASGTGDLTIELLKLNPDKLYSGDISEKMLNIQRQKVRDERVNIMQMDALDIPFEDDSADIITIGFGVRNFEDLEKGLKEINRVLKVNGTLIILEMFKTSSFMTGLFNFYFGRLVPFIGNKISKSKGYTYLYTSVKNFYKTGDFIDLCKNNGFTLIARKNNFIGVVNTLYFSKL